MSTVIVRPGDFTGWDRCVVTPGEVMAWNWPAGLRPADVAFERCFPAIALGMRSGDFVIRTDPACPATFVTALQRLITLEQSAGRPVGVGLAPGLVEDGDDPALLYATLYAVTPGRLDRHLGTMARWLEKAL